MSKRYIKEVEEQSFEDNFDSSFVDKSKVVDIRFE